MFQPSYKLLKHVDKSICACCNSVCKKSIIKFLNKHKTCDQCSKPCCELCNYSNSKYCLCGNCKVISEGLVEKREKMKCETICIVSEKCIWIGTSKGEIAATFKTAQFHFAMKGDCHSHSIKSIIYQPSVDFHRLGFQGKVWTCCNGGELKVWHAQPLFLDDLVEESRFGKMLQVSIDNSPFKLMWILVNEGLFNIYEERRSGESLLTLCSLSFSHSLHGNQQSCSFS